MRKDTLCGKFLFWQKKFEIFCLQSQNRHNTLTLQKSFKKWKSNQNEKWLDLTVHHDEGVQMKMKTYLEYHFGFFRLLPERLKLFLEKIFFIKMSCLHKYIKEIGKRLEENLPILWLLQERENVNYFFKKGRYDGDRPPNLVCNIFVQVSVKEWCWSESNSTIKLSKMFNFGIFGVRKNMFF